ncbi:MAG: hypothetical protein HOG41_08600 [Gammaproteobacteria bacterium]|jgi:hypothetical protein|nr:hypothetical protein [Gammaproteobacteria bacterium]
MKTQLQSTLDGIEVIELEIEEIEIKSLNDNRNQPEKSGIQQVDPRLYRYLPSRQMVA